uniref:Uncharacterized protein n=1 Tax=Physcomitrium patens TaxID=3218 RepID=A0A2K1K668_PHYPA|nr:hypothetical protein PHYPA_011169 [Physcomitrium patens]
MKNLNLDLVHNLSEPICANDTQAVIFLGPTIWHCVIERTARHEGQT